MGTAEAAMGCECCKDQAPPEGAGDHLGALEATGVGCCNRRPYTFASGRCCGPNPPTGSAWEAATAEDGPWQDLLDQCDEICGDLSGCCGPNLERCSERLNEKWLGDVNAHLVKHSLKADLNVFWVYNGQSSSQHMHLRIYKLKEGHIDEPNTSQHEKMN